MSNKIIRALGTDDSVTVCDKNTMQRIAKRIEQQQDDEAWAAQNGVQIHACEDGDWMALAQGRAFGGRTIHEAIGSLRRAIE